MQALPWGVRAFSELTHLRGWLPLFDERPGTDGLIDTPTLPPVMLPP